MTIQISTLKNGLRVATDTTDAVETVSMGVWVKAGTRQETADINGAAHYLEHMAFKGTATRSALDIAEAIENVGGYINAYTSREVTAYHATVLKKDIGMVVDILADILQNSTFLPEEMTREREVILQEIGQTYDSPSDIIGDYSQEQAYPNQPMGWPILGTPETVKAMTREGLMNFMKTHYVPGSMVFAASGNLDHQALVKMVEDAFSLGGTSTHTPVPAAYEGGDFRQHRDLEQLHVMMGFKGVDLYSPDFYVSSLYATLMGGGMSSRLFQEIREKRGLVYSIYSYSTSYKDGGLFEIYAGTSEAEISTLVSVVADELKKSTHSLTEAEIYRAKNQLKAGLLMGLESTTSRAKRLARNLLMHDRLIENREILEAVDKVTATDLQNFAAKLLSSPLNFTTVGPTGNVPTYDQAVKSLRM